MQRLRAEHHIHVGCALEDGLALLAGDAATHADDQAGAGLLPLAPATELREDLLLCFLAHRAGVQQQHIGLLRNVGGDQAMRSQEYVRHLGGVVLVHLTTEGLDVELAGHARSRRAQQGRVR